MKSGMAMHSFEQKGVIEVPFKQGSVDEGNVRALSEEEATELAIDAGAEEIISTMDEVGGDIYQVGKAGHFYLSPVNTPQP